MNNTYVPGRCNRPCSCCPRLDATPSTCTGSGQIGHRKNEYGQVGFSPCGKYVAHQSDIPCNVTEAPKVKSKFKVVHDCQCATTKCDCGSFLSHLISEPCTAVIHR
jgi:hypothetical protein